MKHAEAITEAFNQQNIIAETITGELTSVERANILKRYADNEIKVGKRSGFDRGLGSPAYSCVVLLRPSLQNPQIQMVGHGSRTVNSEGVQHNKGIYHT